MAQPLAVHEVENDTAHAGSLVPAPGGLYIAEFDEFRDAVVVSLGLTGRGLDGLRINPAFPEFTNGSAEPATACQEMELWSKARLVGMLADAHRGQVTDGLASAVFAALCGDAWQRAETAYRNATYSSDEVEKLARHVGRQPGFAVVLKRNFAKLTDNFASGSTWYAELASRFDVSTENGLADFALRLASAPERLPAICGVRLGSLMEALRAEPTLLRGARFLAMLGASSQNRHTCIFPRWDW